MDRMPVVGRHLAVLVEDEQDLGQMLVELMDELGYEVRYARTLGDALGAPEDRLPCVVITDLTLPDAPPEDVVKGLRKKYPGSRILLMSARPKREIQELARNHGADGTIVKPFDLDAFEQALAHDCPAEASAPA
jgi:two-component system response regulator QseB